MRKNFLLVALFALLSVLAAGCSQRADEAGELGLYDFRHTRDLVRRVKAAAKMVEEHGEAAFATLRGNDDWQGEDFYIYVYTVDGVNLFHGGDPSLEGKNLYNVTDIHGRKTFIMSLEALKDPNDPHAWVHYYWERPGRFYAAPKSSCHFLVEMPDGREVVVGGGLSDPPVEKVFMKMAVDAAADLVNEKGRESLDELRDPTSRYGYLGRRVFVLDKQGRADLDPVFLADTDIGYAEKTDEAGYSSIKDLLSKLEKQNQAWVIIHTHNRFQKHPVKKAVYARNAVSDGKPVIVGGMVELPRPAWSN